MYIRLPGRLVFPETTEENEMVRQFAQEQYPLPQNIKQNPSKRENWVRTAQV